MNTVKCPQCNLTNWATAVSCKRCGNMFQAVEQGATQNNPPQIAPPSVPAFDAHLQNQPSYSTSNQTQTQTNGWNQPPAYVSLNPYARNQQSGGQKIKLAVISLITGILGFPLISSIIAGIFAAILGTIFGGAGIILGLVVVLAFIPTSLITGIVALVKVKRYPFEYGGKGIAIAGVVISSISILIFPIIAAIAIPNLLAARRSANEGSAISSIRTIHAAEMTYQTSVGAGNYAELSELSKSQLIDTTLASGQKSGYKFVVTKTDAISLQPAGFKVTAVPITASGFSSTGGRSFYINEEGIIRYSNKPGVAANEKDPVLETSNQRVQMESDDSPPDIVSAKTSANDTSAISSLRIMHAAEVTFQATAGAGNFGHLHELSQGQLISADLASGQKSGYNFTLRKTNSSGGEPASFNISAVPINSNGAASTGTNTYYIDQTGVIRFANRVGTPAGSNDPVLGD